MMMKIAVAGTGYVGLSLAVLLSQNNEVVAVDIDENKVQKINGWISPIQDDYIEMFMLEHEERNLQFRATTNGDVAYASADFVIIVAPTNYDPKRSSFDTTAVESVIELVIRVTNGAEQRSTMVIKSTIPVGFTERIKEQYGVSNIMFFPEFLRKTKALYDNLHPSKIVCGCDEDTKFEAKIFAG